MTVTSQVKEEELELREELQPKLVEPEVKKDPSPVVIFTNTPVSETTVDKPVEKKQEEERVEWVLSQSPSPNALSSQPTAKQEMQNNSPSSAVKGGYLAKPSNIYAEPEKNESIPEHSPVKEPILNTVAKKIQEEEPSESELQLVFKDDIPAADEPRAHQTPTPVTANTSAEELREIGDEVEEQKRRAAERIQKLRNLSFNVNATDPNNEFETVPAYIRRNLELYNTISSVENFYSNYEVRKDDDSNTRISTINTFLDGKKPD